MGCTRLKSLALSQGSSLSLDQAGKSRSLLLLSWAFVFRTGIFAPVLRGLFGIAFLICVGFTAYFIGSLVAGFQLPGIRIFTRYFEGLTLRVCIGGRQAFFDDLFAISFFLCQARRRPREQDINGEEKESGPSYISHTLVLQNS